MAKTLNLTDEERERFAREIENFLEFTRDVLDDPRILDRIPTGSHVKAIPLAERDSDHHYDIETARMVATVTPEKTAEQRHALSSSAPNSNHVRRVTRTPEASRRRARAAQR